MSSLQPSLPLEGIPNDLEQLFISEQPQRLFPLNQNSNFGTLRKVLTDEMQAAVDSLTELDAEAFISTASGYLGRWEDLLALPKAPAGLTDAKRRLLLMNRRARGPFTRTRRRELVESFVTATFGPATEFTTGGIPLTSAGVPLFSGVFSLSGTYTITEDIPNFSYTVSILASIGADLVGLTRELRRITPAHINFTVTTF